MNLDHLPYRECIAMLRKDPSVSFFVRQAVAALEQRDVLDASRDADLVAFLAKKRLDETLEVAIEPADACSEDSSSPASADTA